MVQSHIRGVAALVVATAIGACAGSPAPTTRPVQQQSAASVAPNLAAMAKASSDSARYPYTEADIHFMTGMIAHHAQAIQMASMAPTHGAAPSVRTLCDRIINAQTDEIRLMQQWLRDRRQTVPEPNPQGMEMDMGGMHHTMLMPGMLTAEEIKQLDASRGSEFDRLFLTGMIKHHQGAISMVKELSDTYGADQDELVAKFSQDVQVDQATEIKRMQQMLAFLVLQGHAP